MSNSDNQQAYWRFIEYLKKRSLIENREGGHFTSRVSIETLNLEEEIEHISFGYTFGTGNCFIKYAPDRLLAAQASESSDKTKFPSAVYTDKFKGSPAPSWDYDDGVLTVTLDYFGDEFIVRITP